MSNATRSLTFSDGSSNKFWTIVLNGSDHTVTFGKVGTNGQSQSKSFESEEAARKSYDKLVAEKTKKGYVDAAGAAVSIATTSVSASAVVTPALKQSAKVKKGAASDGSLPIAEAEQVVAVVSTADVDLNSTCEIDLGSEDLDKVRLSAPRKRGAPVPYDKDGCLQRLGKLKTEMYGWDVRWKDLKLPPALSREEAHFWLVAMTEWKGRHSTPTELAELLSKRDLHGHLSVEDIQVQLTHNDRPLPDEVSIPISNLLTTREYYEMLVAKEVPATIQRPHVLRRHHILTGFRNAVIPYLTENEREEVCQWLRKEWESKVVHSASSFDDFPPEYYLAAALGMHKEVYAITSSLKVEKYKETNGNQHPQELVFSLETPELVMSEWIRLSLSFRSPDELRAFLAITRDTALDYVAEQIVEIQNKEWCETMLRELCLVRSPRTALPMLQCRVQCKSPAAARAWLDRNVGRAVVGLIDLAGRKGQLADAAIEYLRGVKQKGFKEVIARALKNTADSAAAARIQAEVLDQEVKVYPILDAQTTPEWLLSELSAAVRIKNKTLPGWAMTALLPPLIIENRRVSDDQGNAILQLLAATPVTTKHPLFAAIRQNIPKSVRDEFTWKLFQNWQEDGFPSKDKWAMGAIAHLGDDGCVLKLTSMIRVWPGESQHARAVFGLECLRAIGSSVALMQLSGIAQKLKFKGLKTKAELFVTEIAKERGLTRDELEDRVVPDCGLDENGRRTFSFGPRSFSFVLSGDLKPMIRDEAGKIRPNLPDPGAKDDATLAAESVAEWKLLKKQIKEVATIQAGRLEQAMVTGRRWSTEDFASLLVRHPLMTHLAQKLIWGGFDAKRNRVATFRVTEERDYADPDDNAASLQGAATVGVVHPLELTEKERNLWGEVLGDYEVVSPFLQLGRPAYLLESGEEKQNDIQRFTGLKLVAPTLVFGLEKMNWVRGVGLDGGGFDEHSKQFPSAQVTAVVTYEGNVGMGWISPDEMLEIKGVYFCQGMRAPSGYGGWNYSSQGGEPKLALKDVPAIVISEVLADMQVLKSKAK